MALMAERDAGASFREAGPSRLVPEASRPLPIKYACCLEQPDGASWFGHYDKSSSPSTTDSDSLEANSSLADRYAESLWLGEFHTGLSHFLKCIDRLRQSHELEDILLGLCHLVKSNNAISRRHKAAATALNPGHISLNDASKLREDGLPEYEVTLVQRAAETAGSSSKSSQLTSIETDLLRKRWNSSMESRE